MKFLPPARNTDIVVQTLGKELLVYDLKTHLAYQLNETSMIIFQACADGLTFEDLKRQYEFSENLIYLSLDELKKKNLLAGDYRLKFTGASRREVIKKVGLATMITWPIIEEIVAPTAAMAQSAAVCTNPAGQPTGTPVMATGLTTFRCQLNLISQCCIAGINNYHEVAGGAGVNCSAICSNIVSNF